MQALTVKGTRLLQATHNMGRIDSRLTDGVGRISSGNRIVNSSDDVASLSVGTQLRTITVSLRQALVNTVQGISMLQIMDDAYSQTQSMLQRMQALALQANSGSLSDAERGFLDQEFSNLHSEITRVGNTTSFNGMQLLGSENSSTAALNTSTALADEASASLVFSQMPTNNQTLRIQNIVFRFRNTPVASNPNDIRIGATVEETVANIAKHFSAYDNPRMSEARYDAVGNTLVITHQSRGALAQNYTIDEQGSSSRGRFDTVGGIQIHISGERRYILGGGSGDGLGMNSTQAYGDIGDNLVTVQNQSPGEVIFQVNNLLTGLNNNQRLRIDDGFNNVANFIFRNTASPTNPFHIQRGANNEETLQNAVTVLTNYVNSTTNQRMYGVRQLEFERDGLTLIMRSKNVGNPKDIYENDLAFTENTTSGVLSSATMSNGGESGVNTSGVINKDFMGKVGGFSSNYTSPDSVLMSITVGEHTYQATVANTQSATDTSIRFLSTHGGYFDVLLGGGNGMAVSSQDDATLFAQRMDAAFAPLTFTQKRKLDSYMAISSVANTSFYFQHEDFSAQDITDFSVYQDSTQPYEIRMEAVIGNVIYKSTKDIGTTIDAYEKVVLYSTENSNHQLIFEHGDMTFDLTDDDLRQAFQEDVKKSFGITQSNNTFSFQVGKQTSNTIELEVKPFSTDILFADPNINILSQEAAALAFDSVGDAINVVMAERADVGAMQSRFNYASRNISSSLRNQQSAMSFLLDTDLPAEMTQYAVDRVLNQAAIATLAQASALREGLVAKLMDNLA